jgi:beta-glucanase (GH16 family)
MGDGSGGVSGNDGEPVTSGGADSDVAPRSGGSSGSDALAVADGASGSGGSSGSDAIAGADVVLSSGGSSGNDAGTIDAPQSGGSSGSDAEAVDASQSGGSSGNDASPGADLASDGVGTSGRDAGLGANDGASSDRASGNDAGFDAGPNWQLIWSDEFNEPNLTGAATSNWNVVTWEPNTVNGEQQKYTARVQNIFHDGQGHLVLRGLNTPWTNNGTTYQYTSGRLHGKFQFSFGRVEVRAKLPAGKGSFPAILLMGTGANWPQSGEIGMMEQWGQDKSSLYCSTYSGSSGDINQKVTFPNAITDFHVYALEWYSDHIVFFIDDVQVAQSSFDTTSPFYTGEFYIVLDVAIGGTMGGTIGDASAFPMDMMLDYVRVYSQS